jgi:hypothetical protein
VATTLPFPPLVILHKAGRTEGGMRTREELGGDPVTAKVVPALTGPDGRVVQENLRIGPGNGGKALNGAALAGHQIHRPDAHVMQEGNKPLPDME